MARSELVIELVKAALTQDSSRVKMLAESIVSEERQKEHHFVADQLSSAISQSGSKVDNTKNHSQSLASNNSAGSVVWRKTAEAKLSDIVLPESQRQEIIELIREQKHAQELIAHGVEPRSTLSNIWFFMFRATSILCLAVFAYGAFIFASNSFIFPHPRFLAEHMFVGFVGVLMWVDARRLSRRMAWLME